MNILKPITQEPSYNYDYLVCFQPRQTGCSWIAKTFGHIVLWRNIGKEYCIRIEPTFEGILIVPYMCNVNDLSEEISKEYRCYVYKTKTEDFKKRNYWVGFNSCVGITKRVLGISKPFILTPDQLEQHIKEKGVCYGKISKEDRQ